MAVEGNVGVGRISGAPHDRSSDASGRRTGRGHTSSISLDDVLITSELRKRGRRRSHLRRTASAIQEFAKQIEKRPSDVLPRFVELAMELCDAGSAGISVYEPQPDNAGNFRWNSLTGKAAPFGGETTPRDFSPCGMCLDKAEPILMDRPGRYYDWLNIPDLPVAEALLVPLFVADRKPFGTLWLMSHDDKRFDRSDALALSEMATVLNLALSMISDIARKAAALEQAEAALHQSYKLAVLGQLSGGIAHDLNNLLAVLSGQLELIQDRVRDDKLKRMAESGIKAAFRGGKLVQQVLSLARRQPLRLDVIDVETVVDEIVDTLRQLASSLSVKKQIANNLWPLRADQDQLLLAILNIAINARDAMMPKGVLTIDVRNAVLQNGPDDDGLIGDFVALAISDTGVGMSTETLKRAFEPFFTTKGDGLGTGLGLSMVAGFARQSAGTVHINSEIGRGTSVTIYLPKATTTDSPN
jgi:signal transduction histidine kinase